MMRTLTTLGARLQRAILLEITVWVERQFWSGQVSGATMQSGGRGPSAARSLRHLAMEANVVGAARSARVDEGYRVRTGAR